MAAEFQDQRQAGQRARGDRIELAGCIEGLDPRFDHFYVAELQLTYGFTQEACLLAVRINQVNFKSGHGQGEWNAGNAGSGAKVG